MMTHEKSLTPRFAYVGSRTTRERDARGVGLSAYRYVPETGACTRVQVLSGLVNPSFLAFDSAQAHLYCVHGDQREASAFAIDSTSGELTLLNSVDTQGINPVHLSVDPTDQFLAVANYATGGFALLAIEADGCLGGLSHLQSLAGEAGPHKVEQTSSHPHMIPFDLSGRFVVIPDKGLDTIFVYRVQTDNGRPDVSLASQVRTRDGSGPRHIVFAPDGKYAYGVNELDSSVTGYAWDGATGALSAREILPALPACFTGNSRAAAIVMAGEYLYVSNRGHDSVATFALGAGGALSLRGHTSSLGRKPRFMNVTPDGKRLYVANEESDTLVAFDIDPASGGLNANGQVIETGSPVCMIFKTT